MSLRAWYIYGKKTGERERKRERKREEKEEAVSNLNA